MSRIEESANLNWSLIMAKRNGARDRPTLEGQGQQEHLLTVSVYPEAKPHVPWIRLRGLWLQQAGFTPQSRIRVRVMTGCLVITKE